MKSRLFLARKAPYEINFDLDRNEVVLLERDGLFIRERMRLSKEEALSEAVQKTLTSYFNRDTADSIIELYKEKSFLDEAREAAA